METVTSETKDKFYTRDELGVLRSAKVDAKVSDAAYLRAHPELEEIVESLYRSVLASKPPKAQLYRFVAEHFRELHAKRGSDGDNVEVRKNSCE
ncbi:hypothetical protein GMRT_12654 [Giardia muris]|uniref:RIIa domain-containing protein n=1 Tax=Giardia muris TaxID=5742 RepID=A0A4Z1SPW5_GIAMU|nr:hypothetical protein GMRT_12654 [Giardia muris]|eukprot:TNJ27846.1 hypothetical protein GMRT_12654 [Giardia muris]